MIQPLEKMRLLRSDLGPAIDILRADIARQLGNMGAAEAFATSSIDAAPAWREARFLRDVVIAVHVGLRTGHEGTSDFDAMLAKLERRKETSDAWQRDGQAGLRGILAYKRGDFSEARALLAPLMARYPTARLFREIARLSEKATERVGAETRLAGRMVPGHAPRLRIRTTKGDVLVELFPDAAPNMVNNFVWLAQQGFYDDTAFHRALPFSFLQGGDGLSRPAAKGGVPDKVGLGGPGYTVQLEDSKRPPLRGRLVAVKVGPGDNGSQFLITTGTCLHLDGEATVFGRTVEADGVLSKLVAGDRILGIDVVSLRTGWEYRPVDRAGQRPDKAEARVVGE
jgi:peptidyl-prolyl cis-trans isomerase B (cyclophilin B)